MNDGLAFPLWYPENQISSNQLILQTTNSHTLARRCQSIFGVICLLAVLVVANVEDFQEPVAQVEADLNDLGVVEAPIAREASRVEWNWIAGNLLEPVQSAFDCKQIVTTALRYSGVPDDARRHF